MNDVNAPLIRLLTTRVSAGRPTIAIQTLDRGAGVDPFSLVLSYGRVLVGAAAYDPFSGSRSSRSRRSAACGAGRLRATFSPPTTRRRRTDVFGRDLMPNTRVRAADAGRLRSDAPMADAAPAYLRRTHGAARRRRRPCRHRPHRALLRREAADPRPAAEHGRALRDDVAEPRGQAGLHTLRAVVQIGGKRVEATRVVRGCR